MVEKSLIGLRFEILALMFMITLFCSACRAALCATTSVNVVNNGNGGSSYLWG